jgi:tetratricopeptide (TPR) repeat protein
MRNRWALLVLMTPMLGFGGATYAQSPDRQRCFGHDLDLSIEGCTSIIQSGQETPENLSRAFDKRGFDYDQKGQYDRTIADEEQAIRLDPNNANPYINRGVAYIETGQYDRAVEDYKRALAADPRSFAANNGLRLAYYGQDIELHPDSAAIFLNRGNLFAQVAPSRTSITLSSSTRSLSLPWSVSATFTLRLVKPTAPFGSTTRPSGSRRIIQ